MYHKKALTVVLVIVLAFLSGGCGGKGPNDTGTEEPPIVIKVGNTDTASRSTNLSMEWLAEYVAEETGGRMEVELYPEGALGDDPELCSGVLLGTNQVYFGFSSVLGGIVGPKLDILDLPFLYDSYDEWVEGSFEKGGLSIYNEMLEGSGYVCLDFMYNGMMNLCSTKKIYHNAEDMKGYRLRVSTAKMNVDLFRTLGADPIPMAWGEVVHSVQNGTVDGLTHSLGVFNDFSLYQDAPYITLTEHQSSPYIVLLSTEFLESMPADLRDIFVAGLHQACAKQREMERKLELEYVGNFVEKGATVYYCTEEEKQAFYERCKGIYADQREVTGPDIFDRFLATAGK